MMPLVRPAFIVFEGLDGTGKSTCARRTADLLEAEYLTTPASTLRPHRDEIVRSLGASQEACQLFYLSTVFAASEEARALVAAGRSVVLDRYFLSTQAYAEFRGSRLDVDSIGAILLPANITVYLTAPLGIRRERLAARGESAADRETLHPAADDLLRVAHERRSEFPVLGQLLRIDTSVSGPDDVAARVLAALG